MSGKQREICKVAMETNDFYDGSNLLLPISQATGMSIDKVCDQTGIITFTNYPKRSDWCYHYYPKRSDWYYHIQIEVLALLGFVYLLDVLHPWVEDWSDFLISDQLYEFLLVFVWRLISWCVSSWHFWLVFHIEYIWARTGFRRRRGTLSRFPLAFHYCTSVLDGKLIADMFI